MTSTYWALVPALVWTAVLLAPWRAWSTRESLEADPRRNAESLNDVTVLIPARNEAASLRACLSKLAEQGPGLKVVVVDDQSVDATSEVLNAVAPGALVRVTGRPLPAGWTGKTWAQHQGEAHLDRPLTLLLDADIELAPGLVASLRHELRRRDAALVSLMVELSMSSVSEKLLLPAFIYFFKLLYPFRLCASRSSRVAAAAGGCVLLRTDVLRGIGGFEVLRDALIDDCALARLVKDRHHPIWLGLTHCARSLRRYRLGDAWRMVERIAYTQLRYSLGWLLLCTALMGAAFVLPLWLLAVGETPAQWLAGWALLALVLSYCPTLRYYRLSPLWSLALPGVGVLYLAMTWSSALRYWRGERSRWRGRTYARE